jgi:hypothetical protein
MMLKEYIWKDTEAKKLMGRILENSLVGWSFIILVLGMLLTITAFIWDRLAGRLHSSIRSETEVKAVVAVKVPPE